MDFNLFSFINNLAGRWVFLDSIAIFLAKYLIYLIVAGAIVVFFLIKTKKEKIYYLFFSGFSIIVSRLVLTELIRLAWHRPRPFIDHQVNLLIGHSTSGSFPSGHATFLFSLATVIYFFNKKFGIIFFVLSFLVGIARVYVGVHYPFDVLGGIIIGIFSAIIIRIFIKPKPRE